MRDASRRDPSSRHVERTCWPSRHACWTRSPGVSVLISMRTETRAASMSVCMHLQKNYLPPPSELAGCSSTTRQAAKGKPRRPLQRHVRCVTDWERPSRPQNKPEDGRVCGQEVYDVCNSGALLDSARLGSLLGRDAREHQGERELYAALANWRGTKRDNEGRAGRSLVEGTGTSGRAESRHWTACTAD
jgi:hypothetical protein